MGCDLIKKRDPNKSDEDITRKVHFQSGILSKFLGEWRSTEIKESKNKKRMKKSEKYALYFICDAIQLFCISRARTRH